MESEKVMFKKGKARTEKPGRGMTAAFMSVLICFMVLGILIPQRTFSESENRYLQKKPEFSWKTLTDGSFGTAYEAYLSDQFPFRNRWIGGKVLAERVQFKTDVNGIYFGKDQYLIEKFDTEDLVGEQLIRNQKRLLAFLTEMRGKMGENHVRAMLVPSASQILEEMLPLFAAPYNQHEVNAWLESQTWEGCVVDTEVKLKEHAKEEIYYKTDHHWTSLGAYYGYTAWAEAAGVTAWSQEDFRSEEVSGSFLGTIHSKLNITWKADRILAYYPLEETNYQVYYDGSKEAEPGLYNYNALGGKDQYSFYLDGNHGLTKIVNPEADADSKGKRLLLIKDSFAHSFVPFIVNHFEEVYMVDLRFYNQDVRILVDTEEITDLLVLYQIPGFAKETSLVKLRSEGS